MARRYDPERRQRIIDAAIRVVEARGIGGLSHRTAAAEADVPLGSTTYHFASLDDLLVAAMEQLTIGPQAELESWEEELRRGASLVDTLTDVLQEYVRGGRGSIMLEYELYLAALRRPVLQPVAAACLDRLAELLSRHTADMETARALTAMIDGVLLRVLLTDRPFERSEVRAALSRVIG